MSLHHSPSFVVCVRRIDGSRLISDASHHLSLSDIAMSFAHRSTVYPHLALPPYVAAITPQKIRYP